MTTQAHSYKQNEALQVAQDTQTAAPGVSVEVNREQFERWAANDGFEMHTFRGEYSSPDTQGAWDAWQASRTALLAGAAAEPVAIGEGFFLPDGTWTGSASRTPGYLRMVEDDEANGCTIRPIYAAPVPVGAPLYTRPPSAQGEVQKDGHFKNAEKGYMSVDFALTLICDQCNKPYGDHFGPKCPTIFATPPTAQAPAITNIRQDGEPS